MSLHDEIQRLLRTYAIPDDAVAAISSEMLRLDENQTAPGPAVGESAPDFRLRRAGGGEVSLAERLAQGPVVLTFYRGDWCPVCNLQLSALQRALPEIRSAGASLIAVAPQTLSHAEPLRKSRELGFDLLVDPEQEVIRKYRLQFTVPPDIREIQMNFFDVDLEKQNGDGSWKLPVPGTFIIDPQGTVRTRHVTADYTVRMEPEDVIEALEGLTAPSV